MYVYETHPSFVAPENENAKIWRYIDLAKLVSLLERHALFFVKASKLEDPYEGSIPSYNKTQRPVVYAEMRSKFQNEEDFKRFLEGMGRLGALYKREKEIVLINSWHLSEFESANMWQSYSRDDKGIAIQSTFKRLRDSFNGNEKDRIWIGQVRYLDYKTEFLPEWNVLEAFVTKRKSFETEKELRVVTMLPEPFIKDAFVLGSFSSDDLSKADRVRNSGELEDNGKFVSVDVGELIERVYVSPKAKCWLKEVVESVVQKYGVDKEIVKSDLYTLT